jgi:hypothetical protein
MTPEESRRDEAGRWLAQARKDLNAAGLLATAEPSRSVFHSQQAAEKVAKALLAFYDLPFRKTHDLNELGKQCAALDASLAPLFREAADLTDLRRRVPLFGRSPRTGRSGGGESVRDRPAALPGCRRTSRAATWELNSGRSPVSLASGGSARPASGAEQIGPIS